MRNHSKRTSRSSVVTLILCTTLGCVPALAHEGTLASDAFKACAQLSLGAVCEWDDANHARYRGTCRLVTSSLLCVRNQPVLFPPEHPADHKGDVSPGKQ